MDEIELIEMDIEFQEVIEEMEQADRAKPGWWLIALGAKDAPRPVYDKSVEIYQKFKRFEPAVRAKDFDTAVALFTAAMIRGLV